MEKRKPLIAGNWKMNKTVSESVASAQELSRRVIDVEHVEIMISPAFPALHPVFEALATGRVKLGAQNVHWEKSGAFTGEVSAEMLRSAGCLYVIIGHSERRQIFGETDASVRRKIKATVESGLRPVLCVGETEEERDGGKTFCVLDNQIDNGLKDFSQESLRDMVIAYEPVWAIGTGKTATPDQVREVHAYLRGLVEKKFGKPLANGLRILYGGSVKPNNIGDLMQADDIDGALVGGASLDTETFEKIIRFNAE